MPTDAPGTPIRQGTPSSRLAWTVPEFAALIGCHRSHVYKSIQRGDIRSVTIGGIRRIPAAEATRLFGAAVTSGGDAA